MILPGCLLVLLLPAGGAVLGKWLDGSEGGLWGLAIGLCSASRSPLYRAGCSCG
jgi:hypothetical protein